MEELCIKFIYLLYILFYGFQNDLCFISVKIIMKKAPLNKVSKLFREKTFLNFFKKYYIHHLTKANVIFSLMELAMFVLIDRRKEKHV